MEGPKGSSAGNAYLKTFMLNLKGEISKVFEFGPYYSGEREEARRPRNRGAISYGNKRCFSSPKHPNRLWAPLSLLSDGYLRLFPRG